MTALVWTALGSIVWRLLRRERQRQRTILDRMTRVIPSVRLILGMRRG